MSLTVSARDWANYIGKLSALNEEAAEKMKAFVRSYGFSDMTAVTDYAYGLATKYGEGSAALSAAMYDAVAEMSGNNNTADSKNVMEGQLIANPDINLVLCHNDDTALGVLYTCKHMGLRIPDDVCICGYGDGIRAISCDPQLTTIVQRGHDVGREAGQIMLDILNGTIPP